MAEKVSNRRRVRRRLVLAVVVLIASFAITEAGLRLGLGLGRPLLYQLDADCGYLPVANQDIRRFGAHVQINDVGMRSEPVRSAKPSNELRLLVCGDSVTFGTTRVEQADIFTSRLQRTLQDQLRRPVEVLNASAGGWAVANEAGFLRSRGLFAANVVLLVLNTGDLVQPYNLLKPQDALNYPQQPPIAATLELWERYVRPRLFHSAGAAADAGAVSSHAADAVRDLPPILTAIDGIRTECDAGAARLVIVFIPAASPDWQLPGYADALNGLKAWASQRSVPLWDLTPQMLARPINELYQDGIHPTAAGHAVIAERLTRELIAMNR